MRQVVISITDKDFNAFIKIVEALPFNISWELLIPADSIKQKQAKKLTPPKNTDDKNA